MGDDLQKESKWYAVHIAAGQENKVKALIEEAIEKTDWKEKIFNVLLPAEDKIEIKKGKKRKLQKKFFPSYLFINMICDDDTMHFVLNIPGVTNFIGIKNKPSPVDDNEINKLIKKLELEKSKEEDKYPYKSGDRVKIIEGPFKSFTGIVDSVNVEKNKIKVLVRIFGRTTPVELTFEQVTLEDKVN